MNHGKNILITGASGLLGRSLMVRLKDLILRKMLI